MQPAGPAPTGPGAGAGSKGCEGGCLLIVVIVLIATAVSTLFNGCSQESSDDDHWVVVTSIPGTPSAADSSRPDGGDPCDEAMSTAAAVPLAETNDAEVAETLRVCDSYAAWASAFRNHPDMIGLSRPLTEADIRVVLQVACTSAPTSNVCTDAEAQGLLP